MTASTLRRIVGKYKTAQEDRSLTDRGLALLPAAGVVGGAAWGAASPTAFDPSGMFPGLKEGVGKGSGKARLASSVLGGSAMASIGALPFVMNEGFKAVAATPPSRDSRAAPIMIKKSSEIRGQELIHYMWDELERLNGKRY